MSTFLWTQEISVIHLTLFRGGISLVLSLFKQHFDTLLYSHLMFFLKSCKSKNTLQKQKKSKAQSNHFSCFLMVSKHIAKQYFGMQFNHVTPLFQKYINYLFIKISYCFLQIQHLSLLLFSLCISVSVNLDKMSFYQLKLLQQ